MSPLRPLVTLPLLTLLACGGAPDDDGGGGGGGDDRPVDAGDFSTVYDGATNPDLQAWEDYLASMSFLETIADSINTTFALPRDAMIATGECGMSNAFWTEQDSAVVLCLELVNDVAVTFANSGLGLSNDEVAGAAVNTYLWVAYHEMGHALVDLLDLPITGREEDAVDEFSTLLFIEGGAGWAAVDAGFWFYLVDQGVSDPSQLADEHALGLQRFYNVLCLVYGSDPDEYAGLAELFPEMEARFPRCLEEYADKSDAWTQLLEPHVQ